MEAPWLHPEVFLHLREVGRQILVPNSSTERTLSATLFGVVELYVGVGCYMSVEFAAISLIFHRVKLNLVTVSISPILINLCVWLGYQLLSFWSLQYRYRNRSKRNNNLYEKFNLIL